MSDGKPETIDAAAEVIVLAFDLFDSTLPKTPTLLAHALQSPPVQDAIKTTLLNFANAKRKKGVYTVESPEEGRKLLEAIGKGVVDAGQKDVVAQIKKSSQYKTLEKSLVNFQKAVESSSLGVWVDKQKGILYVVGVALVAGTAGVLYYTKTTNTAVKKAVDLGKESKFEVLQIGTLKFAASLWDFQPDARILGAKVMATKKWENVSLDLRVGLLAQGASVQEVQGAAVMKSGGFSVNLSGTAKPQVQQVNLALKLDYTGVVDNGTFNVGIGAMYQDNKGSGTLGASYKTGGTKVGLEGNVGAKDGGGIQYGGMLKLSVDL